MMLAVVSMFTACEDTDAQLAEKLKGTWKGTTLINKEEYPMTYQFFESTDGKTGKFVEITSDKYTEEVNGEEYKLPFNVYVGGTYKIDEGWISLSYFPETTLVELDEDYLRKFAEVYLQSERMTDNTEWADATPEDVMDLYTQYIDEEDQGSWIDMYKTLNENKADGFSNLTINEGKMSYKTGDAGRVEFESIEDIFIKYPFED